MQVSLVKLTNQKLKTSNNNNHNHKVYIHCRAGHGRSAAVVMAYLISKEDPMNINLLNTVLSNHMIQEVIPSTMFVNGINYTTLDGLACWRGEGSDFLTTD